MDVTAEKHRLKVYMVLIAVVLPVLIYLLYMYVPSFYYEVGLTDVKFIGIIPAIICGTLGGIFLHYTDKRLSNKIWSWMRRRRKLWLWLKQHFPSSVETVWLVSEEDDYWRLMHPLGLEEMQNWFNFLCWLKSVQVLCGTLIISIFEEIVFRGILIYLIISRTQNLILAIFFSSIVFAIIHLRFGIHVLPSKFLDGLVFSLSYIISGTLFASFFTHCLFSLLTWKAWRKTYDQICIHLIYRKQR